MILPLVWSVPEALITAELATTFPENSGYVAWVTAAFGPFWGFQVLVVCYTTATLPFQLIQLGLFFKLSWYVLSPA